MESTNRNPSYTQWLALCEQIAERKFGESTDSLAHDRAAAEELAATAWSNGESPENAINLIRRMEAERLWEKLTDTPVNTEDQIDEPFMSFSVGTSKLDIWEWFETTFNLSVAMDLQGLR